MEFKLSKAQADIARWAVAAAPEEEEGGLMDDNPDMIYGEHPRMDNLNADGKPGILTIDSKAWAGDFVYRILYMYMGMIPDLKGDHYPYDLVKEIYPTEKELRNADLWAAREVRSSEALADKVTKAFDLQSDDIA